MGVEFFNLAQLKDEISSTLQEYRERVQNENTPRTDLITMIQRLILERELFFDFIDEIKEEQSRLVPVMFHRNRDYTLLIKEVDESVINDLNLLARKLGRTAGELLSFLMKEVVKEYDGTFPRLTAKNLETILRKKQVKISIYDHDLLSVSDQDLVETNAKVSFRDIDDLEFTDISNKTFMNHIGHITGCGLVRVPRSLSKLLVYAKCNNCGQIEFVE